MNGLLASTARDLRRFARTAPYRLGWQQRRMIGGRPYRFGASVVLPATGRSEFEPWMDPVYAAAFALGPGAFVDVGVHRMQNLVKLLEHDPGRRYVGFEPQLPAALAAQEFARRNRLDGVDIVCAGLSDAAGAALLQVRNPDGFDSLASTSPDFRRPEFYRGSFCIPLLTGDDALGKLGVDEVRLISVDVEGAELEVFRGLAGTLARAKPVVLFEVLNDWADPQGDPVAEAGSARRSERADALAALLQSVGLQLFAIRRDGVRPIDRITRVVSSDLSLCNYGAVPREQAARFADGVVAAGGGGPADGGNDGT